MVASLYLLVFPVLMAFAASSDLLTMRISNRLVLLLVAAFFVMALVTGLPLQLIGLHIACALVVLVVAIGFYSMKWIGGGDGKLAAATTLWLGFGLTLPYFVYAALIGGALTLGILAARRLPLSPRLSRIGWIDRLHDRSTGIPYGIALAASALIVYAQTPIFRHFAA